MFIAYQNNIARYVKSTREELEVIRNVSFDRIKEVPFAEMFNGVVYTDEQELFQAKTKAVEEIRANLYAQEVDPITAHINRLRDDELTPEIATEIAKLVEERKAKVAYIKELNPYPVEPIENIEELPAVEETSDTEVVVSKMETNEDGVQ